MRFSSVTPFTSELVVATDIAALQILTALPASAPAFVFTDLAAPAFSPREFLEFPRREPRGSAHDRNRVRSGFKRASTRSGLQDGRYFREGLGELQDVF